MIKTNTKHKTRCVSLLILFVLLAQNVSPALACGPFTLDPLFSFTKHGGYPLPDYAKGNVGVVPDSFGRMSLFVFYRQLSNLPLTAKEQEQVVKAMKIRIGGDHWSNQEKSPQGQSSYPAIEEKPDYVAMWKSARAQITGGEANITTDKRIDENYNYIHNCLPDAFRNASESLAARRKEHGVDANVREWVKGQDLVFDKCGSGEAGMPEALTENYPEWLRKDRQYQIAAALFYAGKLKQAREAFEKVSGDQNSVWNKTAKFVVARTYIREASDIDAESPDYAEVVRFPSANTIGNTNATANYASNTSNASIAAIEPRKEIKSVETKKKEKAELEQKGEAQLRSVLGDVSMREFHQSAARLLNLLKYRSNPMQRAQELAGALAAPGENPNIYNDLTDYIRLMDRVEGDAQEAGIEFDRKEAERAGKEQDYDYTYRLKLRDVPANDRRQELTDWLLSYQAVDSFAHAVDRWRNSRKIAWLVLALVKADAKSPQFAELLAAADEISPASPAYATARFHQIRLLLENGKRDEARRKLNEVYTGGFDRFNVSTRNKFTAQRMVLAENLDEFLKYAQRRPATFVWSDDANEEGTDLNSPAVFDSTDLSDKKMRVWANRTMFDQDAVAFFNEKMPLSVLKQAATSPQLPDHLKKFVATAGWTRALVLKNQAFEREFAALMTRHAPEYNPLLSNYAAAPTPAGREALGLLLVLRFPVMQPFVPVGYGRESSPPTSIDSTRGNWWCVKNESEKSSHYYDHYNFKHPTVYPNFLSAEASAEADRERKALAAAGNSATHLARRAVEFASRNPNHPHTPEILHLAVRSTRYGCKDEATLELSKQAFQILHRRYPNSEWTKKTPYWFG